MRRGAGRAVLACFVLALGACGGSEAEVVPRMQLEFASQALFADAALLAIYFYGEDQSCEQIRASQPRPTSILGPYRANLDEPGRQSGIVFRVDAVPVGTYTVFVDALDLNGGLVGTGCSPGQRVLERDVAAIKVTIQDS